MGWITGRSYTNHITPLLEGALRLCVSKSPIVMPDKTRHTTLVLWGN